jgi:hypothetical protein
LPDRLNRQNRFLAANRFETDSFGLGGSRRVGDKTEPFSKKGECGSSLSGPLADYLTARCGADQDDGFRDEADPHGSALRRINRSAGSGTSQPTRVSLLRPTTLLAVMVVIGVLAALPFRRPSDQGGSTAENAVLTGPSGHMIDSLSAARGGWGDSPAFDPSLAWQPVPMTLPGQQAPELPPMPDSYYDVAFEIERPEPVRDRFPAAAAIVDPRGMSLAGTAQGTSGKPAQRPHADLSNPGQWANALESIPQASEPLPERIAVDDLIADRFVFTPLAPPAPPTGRSAISPAGNRTSQQGGSISRTASTHAGDASRPKHFIREPD